MSQKKLQGRGCLVQYQDRFRRLKVVFSSRFQVKSNQFTAETTRVRVNRASGESSHPIDLKSLHERAQRSAPAPDMHARTGPTPTRAISRDIVVLACVSRCSSHGLGEDRSPSIRTGGVGGGRGLAGGAFTEGTCCRCPPGTLLEHAQVCYRGREGSAEGQERCRMARNMRRVSRNSGGQQRTNKGLANRGENKIAASGFSPLSKSEDHRSTARPHLQLRRTF